MSIRYGRLLLLAAALLGGIARPSAAQSASPVYNPANGHWYQYVSLSGQINWLNARAAAASVSYAGYPGHLATVTSEDENQFLSNYLTTVGLQGGIWIGGYQNHSARDYHEPAGGWRWVTGEPWSYTSWSGGEPNDAGGGEDALEANSGGTWNDYLPLAGVGAYVIEYEPTPINTGPLLSFSPNPVIGGQTATGQLILPQPAALGGVIITLSSSNPAAAVVPASVTVPPSASAFSFPVTTFAVGVTTPVTITAVGAAGLAMASLQVLPGGAPVPSPPGPPASGTPVFNPANGHWYELVRVPGQVSWSDARKAAQSLSYAGFPGHLVTVTSAAEEQFVVGSVLGAVSDNEWWWMGGYQDTSAPDYHEPAGGWRWVTGEPWSYTDWASGQPDNTSGVENFLGYFLGKQWNDFPPAYPYNLSGYVVEFEPPLSPSPAGTGQLVLFPNPVPGGLLALGQAILAQPAGAGGMLIRLTSSNPAAAMLPTSVTVAPGASAATFPIVTFPVAAPTPVTITAACDFGPLTAVLQLLPLPGGSFPPGSNLLANGSFEDPSALIGGFVTVGMGGLPGWQVTHGTVDVLNEGSWQAAPDGGHQSIDLVGSPGAGTIEQSFPTEPGRDYVFSGYVSHNPGVPYGRADVLLNGSPLVRLMHTVPNRNADMKWQFFSYPFRATAFTTTLTISDVTGIDLAQGTALDGLSVALAPSAIPAPIYPASGLAAPSNLAATMATEARVRLAWTDVNTTETGIALWRKGGGNDWTKLATLPANSTSFTDAGVSPSTLYTYRVQATSSAGASSDFSNEASLTTPAAPAAPTGLTATASGAGQISLAWSVNPQNSAAVEVYRQAAGGNWKLIAVLAPGSTSYLDRGLTPGAGYTYRLRAANGYFASGWSNQVSLAAGQ